MDGSVYTHIWNALLIFCGHFLYRSFRLLFSLLVMCWWRITGTHTRAHQRSLPGNYGVSAHVLDIWFRYKMEYNGDYNCLQNFCLTHNKFDHPEIILKDNVMLLTVTKSEAYFIETDPGTDPALTSSISFLRVAMFLMAKRIITMPLSSLHRLAERLGDPSGKLVFLSNTGRCGSTLLVRFFEETKMFRCYSEHDVFDRLSCMWWSGENSGAETHKLISSCVRVLCKPRSDMQGMGFIFKNRHCSTMHLISAIAEVFPESQHLFLYRDGLDVTNSFRNINKRSTFWSLYNLSVYVSPAFARYCCMWVESRELEPEGLMPFPPAVRISLVWISAMHQFQILRAQGVDIRPFKYDCFVKNPQAVGSAVLDFLGLPQSLAEVGLQALSVDSHSKDPVYKQQKKRELITPRDLKIMNQLALRYNIPKFDEVCHLEPSIC